MKLAMDGPSMRNKVISNGRYPIIFAKGRLVQL